MGWRGVARAIISLILQQPSPQKRKCFREYIKPKRWEQKNVVINVINTCIKEHG
jgi:hypothetical protein